MIGGCLRKVGEDGKREAGLMRESHMRWQNSGVNYYECNYREYERESESIGGW